MVIENLKELISDIERLEEVTSEKAGELEMKYGVSFGFLSILHSEIKKIKIRAGRKHLTPEIILMVLEEELIMARFDYEYYTELAKTLDLDDERLGDVVNCQDDELKKIEKYNMLLGVPAESIDLNYPKK